MYTMKDERLNIFHSKLTGRERERPAVWKKENFYMGFLWEGGMRQELLEKKESFSPFGCLLDYITSFAKYFRH